MSQAPEQQPHLSVVVPVFNEEDCVRDVLTELRQVLDGSPIVSWEAIVVDDGSHDRTVAIFQETFGDDARFRLIRFKRNCGQTAAFDAGFRAARGVLVGMMDGDGQNDPRDFPRLIAELERSGVDMMCGIRKKREDGIVRRISSRIGNGFRNWMTRERITDVGCSIRVFKRHYLDRIKLYEGMHRFFPTLFRIEGAVIGEIPVNHRPRTRGRSKYGIGNRLWKGLRDVFAVRWMQQRALHYEIMDRSKKA